MVILLWLDERLDQLDQIFNKYIKYRAEYKVDIPESTAKEVSDRLNRCRLARTIPGNILGIINNDSL